MEMKKKKNCETANDWQEYWSRIFGFIDALDKRKKQKNKSETKRSNPQWKTLK